jgi:signal peptidase II
LRRVAIIAAVIAVLDQLTKWLVVRYISPSEVVSIIDGYFQFVNWHNTGAAWGVFRDYNIVLAIISVVTILGLYFFRHSFGIEKPVAGWALGFIAGGIIGNVVDRLRLGHVVDFLDVYVGPRHWPAFNIADSAICVGVVLYILVSWNKEVGETQKS